MGVLGGEKAQWAGAANRPPISGILLRPEKRFVGGGWAVGGCPVKRVWAEREAGPFQSKSDSFVSCLPVSCPRVQRESFNLIGLISKRSGYKVEGVGSERGGGGAVLSTNPTGRL